MAKGTYFLEVKPYMNVWSYQSYNFVRTSDAEFGHNAHANAGRAFPLSCLRNRNQHEDTWVVPNIPQGAARSKPRRHQ